MSRNCAISANVNQSNFEIFPKKHQCLFKQDITSNANDSQVTHYDISNIHQTATFQSQIHCGMIHNNKYDVRSAASQEFQLKF